MQVTKKQVLIASAVSIVIAAAGLVMFAALLFASFSNDGFELAQDCNGVTIALTGMIRDIYLSPVANAQVVVKRFPAPADGEILAEIQSQADGRFEVTKPIHLLACDDFMIEISKTGFESKLIRDQVLDYVSDLSTQKFNPIELNITLERSS